MPNSITKNYHLASEAAEVLADEGMIRQSTGFDWPEESPDSVRLLSVYGAAYAIHRLLGLGIIDESKLQTIFLDERGVK